MSTRHIPVPGTFNIRDLGGYQTQSGETAWRRILRADGLHRMKPEGVAQLQALGVRTVIDLRRGHELEAGPNPFQHHAEVAFHHIPLFDELDLAEARARGPNILLTLYRRALAERQAEIRAVLEAIAASPEDGLVLFHCTAGKDRTGIIAALLLSLAGVSRADIVADYALTKAQIEPLRDDLVARVTARGDDVAAFLALLACEPETMAEWLDHLEAEHQDVPNYLAAIGLDATTIARLRSRLLTPAGQNDAVVYKILTRDELDRFQREGELSGTGSDKADGFIHMSAASQVAATVERYFSNRSDVMLVAIDIARLGAALRWEPSRGGALFPHLYAVLPYHAVLATGPLAYREDATVRLPA